MMPTGVYRRPSAEECFWSHVVKTETCWLWTASVDRKGYGHLRVSGKLVLAHRFAYDLLMGPILAHPDRKLDHDHRCPKNCVNPYPHWPGSEGLRIVTDKENQENRSGPQINSKTGISGVTWSKQKGKWHVRVKHHRKTYHGGFFPLDRLADAEAAAVALRSKLFTHNDRDGLESA